MNDYFKKFGIMFFMTLLLAFGSCVGVFAEEFDSYTKLLMHMDDSNFRDECGHSVTNKGVTLNTTIKEFSQGSALFNGSSSRLEIPFSEDWNFDNGDFTIESWIKTTTSVGEIIGAFNGDSQPYPGFLLGVGFNGNNGKLVLFISNNKTSQVVASNTLVNDNQWHHVVAERKANNILLFIDGKLDKQTAITITTLSGSNKTIYIGCDTNPNPYRYFNGYIDEVRISKGIARWASSFTPPTTPYGQSISLDKSSVDLTEGDSIQLTATTTPEAAQVNWSSSDESVATVDSSGKVTGVKEGHATITATINDGSNMSASCAINVTPKTTEPTDPQDPAGDGTLFIELVDGNIKSYDVSSQEITNFINWYKNRDLDDSQSPVYKFKKGDYTDYVVHDKIDWFEIR